MIELILIAVASGWIGGHIALENAVEKIPEECVEPDIRPIDPHFYVIPDNDGGIYLEPKDD